MNSSGITKPPGTELTFTNSSTEMQQIIDSGAGYPKVSLPMDLPGREHFLKAGFDSLQKILALAPDWESVKGIGGKTAEEIDEYFINKNKKEE